MRARPLRAACVVALAGCAPPAAPRDDTGTSPDVSSAPAVFALRAFIPTIDGQRPAVGFAVRVDNNHGLFREATTAEDGRARGSSSTRRAARGT